MSFFARLEARARAIDSLLCVGLDPHTADLDRWVAAGRAADRVEAARRFCLQIIEQTADSAACFKPNAAFFEALGPAGHGVLAEVIAAVPDDIPLILDAKRGDIASTAAAYAAACAGLGARCVTISPYLGRDSVTPFVDDPERAIFLLCHTSNPGAAELQRLAVGDGISGKGRGEPLYVEVARRALRWSEHRNIGFVVGATHPETLARVRAAAPAAWFLAPGIGAQGGSVEDALAAGLRADGLGVLVSSSRGISRAEDPAAAARAVVERIRAARRALAERVAPPVADARARLAQRLVEAGCVRFGSFTLKSGLTSPIYIDLRRLIGDPGLLADVARAMCTPLAGLPFDRIASLPYAGVPIGTAIGLIGGYPHIYPRKEAKQHGTKATVEGVYRAGERVVIVDDLATRATSILEALPRLTGVGLEVSDVVVLIDRESGATARLAAHGIRLHAVFRMGELLDLWRAGGAISAEQERAVRDFLAGS